jgi:predicted nucleotide-binding protein
MNTPASKASNSRVAIVCRDDPAGESVMSFVAQLGLEPVITQQPVAQASSLDALEALRQTAFALVLQADRQLEIGFLLGALGRTRICVLQAGEGQDTLAGLLHQTLDDAGVWKLLLAREMKKAGLEVDLNKAF